MSRVKSFWNKEYKEAEHLALSMNPSGDLIDFTRWYEKEFGLGIFEHVRVLDIGCGNGRNSIFLAKEFNAKGLGFDISKEAVVLAKKAMGKNPPFSFVPGDIASPLPAEDGTIGLVLDLMVSHCLADKERELYLKELVRVLEPGGVVLWKSFLKEGDYHTTQLLRKHGLSGEKNSYIHPTLGGHEHVWTEDAFREFVDPYFTVEVFKRSPGFKRSGDVKTAKRRSFVAYLVKK